MRNTPQIAVTGGNGALATALREWLPDARYLSRDACDVRSVASVRTALIGADVVVHAAALTDHQHPSAADILETNVFGTEYVARWCRAHSARLIYLSTHYVYPGERGNYTEHDATAPIGAYAWSKLAGERWAELAPNRLVVRGSWYTAAKLALWGREGAFVDAYCSREPVRDAARKLAALVLAGAQGTYNIGGPRRSFANIYEDERGIRPRRAHAADWSGPYRFSRDSSVDTARFEALRLPAPVSALGCARSVPQGDGAC